MTALRELTAAEKEAANLLLSVCEEMDTQARVNSYVASPEQLRRSLSTLADWSQGWANRLEGARSDLNRGSDGA